MRGKKRWRGRLAAFLFILAAVFLRTVQIRAEPVRMVSYIIEFSDEQDSNTYIFYPQSGTLPEGEAVKVIFPEQIVGRDGYQWTATVSSPQMFELIGAGTHKFTVSYERGDKVVSETDPDEPERVRLKEWLARSWEADCAITGQDSSGPESPYLISANEAENNQRIRNLVSAIRDGDSHDFYLIGKDYSPSTRIIGTEFDTVYSASQVDSFRLDGSDYEVWRVSVTRRWAPESCSHRYEMVSQVENTCLKNGSRLWRCLLCQTEKTEILPAMGHGDKNGDTVCDRCGARYTEQQAGSVLSTILSLDGKELPLTFTCVDEDYAGTGYMLYVCDDVLMPDITGPFYEHDSYDDSPGDQWLNLTFANGLTVSGVLKSVEREDAGGRSDKAFLLSKEEYEAYRAAKVLPAGSGMHFLRTMDGTGGVYRAEVGGVFPADISAADTGIRPAILLEKPVTGETAEETVWSEGDVQLRQVGEEILSFTCVDTDYHDWQDTHRKAALFLCDSIIRADILTTPADGEVKTLSFGENNNYKTSDVREWLTSASANSTFNMEPIHTGVQTAYTGSTAAGGFGQTTESGLTRYEIGYQLMNDRLFCLSLEEALKYREDLWRFGSESENPESQMSAYSQGFYLRTPFYLQGEGGGFAYGNQIYGVDLNGSIHPVGTDSETYGLRPAFALPQP